MAKIQPSPALMVSSNTPVSECVRMMRRLNVGSLLITSYSNPSQLVGIFTERDLLKWIDELQLGGHWEKPVHHLMTRSVSTITPDEIPQAARIMVEGKFRHLPVLAPGAGGRKQVIGVISMRDVLAWQLGVAQASELKPRVARGRTKSRVTLLVGGKAKSPLERILGAVGQIDVERRDPTQERADRSEGPSDLVVLDLDGMDPPLWAGILKDIVGSIKRTPVVVAFTPSQLGATPLRLLKNLASAGKIDAYEKPLNVMGFLSRVRERLEIT